MAALLAQAPMSDAACSPVQLSPCAPAIRSNRRPSGACCARLRQQRRCLCGYLRNPALRRYVNSPGAKRVASTCRVHVRC
ncbi:Non-specific lipid-transfer protein 2 [Bienertia sinuspersici]